MSMHEQWDEAAAGYALHALEPDEQADFLEHLSDCARCRELVDEHSLVAAQLGSLAGDDASPPSWSAIREGIVGPGPAAGDADVVVLRRRPRFAVMTSAAAAVAVLAAGVLTWQATRGGTAKPLASAAACRHTSGCHIVALDTSAGAAAQLLIHDGRAAVVPIAMPAPPAGSVWALWQLPRGGSPLLLTEFATGKPSAALKVGYGQTAGFAVSRETVGTTPAAPGEVVAAGSAA